MSSRDGSVVKGRDELGEGGKTANYNEDILVTLWRSRKWTESVNSNRNKGFINFGCRMFWDRNRVSRLVFLAVGTCVNEVDYMCLDTNPCVAMEAKKLQSLVNAMMTKNVVMELSDNGYLLVGSSWYNDRWSHRSR